MSVSQKPQPLAGELAPPASLQTSARLEPGPLARLAARLRGGSLDGALAAGADPRASEQLAARARLLTSPRSRARTAEAIERLVRSAQGPQRRWWALGSHDAVLENASELHRLASLLLSGRPVYAHGVAALNALLTDGTGPVYRGRPAELAPQLQRVRTAIEGCSTDDFRSPAPSEW